MIQYMMSLLRKNYKMAWKYFQIEEKHFKDWLMWPTNLLKHGSCWILAHSQLLWCRQALDKIIISYQISFWLKSSWRRWNTFYSMILDSNIICGYVLRVASRFFEEDLVLRHSDPNFPDIVYWVTEPNPKYAWFQYFFLYSN